MSSPLQQSKRSGAWANKFADQFFKTRLCIFWQQGMCRKGNECKYAHGMTELQERPDLANTSYCPRMAVYGNCDNPGCEFAHTLQALRATGSFYKTKMCMFNPTGGCRLGMQCRYAHSETELQKASQEDRFLMDQQGKFERSPSERAVNSVNEFDQSSRWSRVLSTPADWVPYHRVSTNESETIKGDFSGSTNWQRGMTSPVFNSDPHLAGLAMAHNSAYDSSVEQLSTVGRDTDAGSDQPDSSWWSRSASTPADLAANLAPDLREGGPLQAAWRRTLTGPLLSQYVHADIDDDLDQLPAGMCRAAMPARPGPFQAAGTKEGGFPQPPSWKRKVTGLLLSECLRTDTDGKFDQRLARACGASAPARPSPNQAAGSTDQEGGLPQPPPTSWKRMESGPTPNVPWCPPPWWTRSASTPADLAAGCPATDFQEGGPPQMMAWRRVVTGPRGSQYVHAAHNDFDQYLARTCRTSAPAHPGPNRAAGTTGEGLDGKPAAWQQSPPASEDLCSNYEHVDTDDEFDNEPFWARMTPSTDLGPSQGMDSRGGGIEEPATWLRGVTLSGPPHAASQQRGRPPPPDELNKDHGMWCRVRTTPVPQTSALGAIGSAATRDLLAPIPARHMVGRTMALTALLPQQAAGAPPWAALPAQDPVMTSGFEAKHLQREMPRIDED